MLRQRIPFFEQMGLYVTKIKHHTVTPKKTSSENRMISSPKLLTQFSTIGRVIRRNSHFEHTYNDTNEDVKADFIDISEEKKKPETPNKNTDLMNLHILRANSGNVSYKKEKVITKSRFFEESTPDMSPTIQRETLNCTGSVLFCVCGKICAKTSSMCEECLASCKVVEAAGYLYVKRDSSNLDRLWFQLVNTDLYCNLIICLFNN